MRFSANENFPGAAVAALRTAGHDVFWVRTEMGGATDRQVLSHAAVEGRTLLTFDEDFGDLVYRDRLSAPYGIVLFRIPTTSPEYVAERVRAALDTREDWSGIFAVVDADQIRFRSLHPLGVRLAADSP